MERVVLTNGKWFDLDKAERFNEDTRFDGSNQISVATGSQWDHQEVVRTRKGMWVLHSWSQWQGSIHTWEEMDEEDAHDWLLANGHADAVPQDAMDEREV